MLALPQDFIERTDWHAVAEMLVRVLPVALAIGLGIVAALAWYDRGLRGLTLERIRALELPPSADGLETALAALRARDAALDLGAVQAQAARLLALVLGPPPTLAALPLHELSDGMARRLLASGELQRGAVWPRGVEVQSTRIIGAFAERVFDALHVLVEWRDPTAPERPRADVMVFVRRPHVATRALQTDRCPACAAPYVGGAMNLCTHCKAVLNSGEYGWVLTQHADLEGYRGPWREFRGVEPLLARDSGFSPEALEDRASLLFWRWLSARTGAGAAVLARYAEPAAQNQVAERVAELARGGRREWAGQVSLHGADIVRVRAGTDEGLDEVHVRLRWSGRFGPVAEGWDKPQVANAAQATVFTLVRDARAQSDLRRGISTDRCAHCGAAMFEVQGEACSYCQASLPPRDTDFVLRRADGWETWLQVEREREDLDAEVNPFIPAFKFVHERERLLQAMAALMVADGEIAQVERRLLHRTAEMWGVPPLRVREWLEHPVGLPPLNLPRGSWVARAFVEALITAACIDGHVDRHERALLWRVAGELGVEAPSVIALRSRAATAPRAR